MPQSPQAICIEPKRPDIAARARAVEAPTGKADCEGSARAIMRFSRRSKTNNRHQRPPTEDCQSRTRRRKLPEADWKSAPYLLHHLLNQISSPESSAPGGAGAATTCARITASSTRLTCFRRPMAWAD